MKRLIKNTPIIGSIARSIYRAWINPPKPFSGSESYWAERYASGGNSGEGSYGDHARFKAEVINSFVQRHGINTVIEYGCGDGNQLTLADYPSYLGFDVSDEAVAICRSKFGNDHAKAFKAVKEYAGQTAELTLSLDVIFHLVEDEAFDGYMRRLFDSAKTFVIIYSSDIDREGDAAHVRHRKFSDWVARMKPDWCLLEHIPNRYPYDATTETGSFADFYIYGKA